MFLVVDLRLEFMEGHVHGGMKLLGRASALMFPHYGNNGLVNIHENWLTGGRLTPIIPVAILWSASRGSRSRSLTGKWASSKASLKKSFVSELKLLVDIGGEFWQLATMSHMRTSNKN